MKEKATARKQRAPTRAASATPEERHRAKRTSHWMLVLDFAELHLRSAGVDLPRPNRRVSEKRREDELFERLESRYGGGGRASAVA